MNTGSDKKESPAKRSFTSTLAKMIAVIIVVIVFCEIGLRAVVHFELIGKNSPFILFMKYREADFGLEEEPLFKRSEDPILGWTGVPGRWGHIEINSDGFRGRDYPKKPPAGVERVAFLGDSETFGRQLRAEHTVAGVLETELNSRSEDGTKYEVLNFGIPGYNTAQELHLLKTKALNYSPSVVVVYYVFNDPELARNTIMFSGRGLRSRFYLDNLLVFIKAAIEPMRVESKDISQYYKNLHNSKYFEEVKEIMGEMSTLTDERGIRFVLLIAPEIYKIKNLGQGYPYHDIHDKLHAVASERIEVVDPLNVLAPLWDAKKPKKLWVLPHDPHKNHVANKEIGALLARELLK